MRLQITEHYFHAKSKNTAHFLSGILSFQASLKFNILASNLSQICYKKYVKLLL